MLIVLQCGLFKTVFERRDLMLVKREIRVDRPGVPLNEQQKQLIETIRKSSQLFVARLMERERYFDAADVLEAANLLVAAILTYAPEK